MNYIAEDSVSVDFFGRIVSRARNAMLRGDSFTKHSSNIPDKPVYRHSQRSFSPAAAIKGVSVASQKEAGFAGYIPNDLANNFNCEFITVNLMFLITIRENKTKRSVWINQVISNLLPSSSKSASGSLTTQPFVCMNRESSNSVETNKSSINDPGRQSTVNGGSQRFQWLNF